MSLDYHKMTFFSIKDRVHGGQAMWRDGIALPPNFTDLKRQDATEVGTAVGLGPWAGVMALPLAVMQ